MAEQMALLVKQRGRIRGKLTKFGTFIAKLDDEPEKRVELSSRIEKARDLWLEFDTVQNKIEDIDQTDAQEIERASFEDAYHALITKAERLSVTAQAVIPQNIPVNAQPVLGEQFIARPVVKLPNIELPKFDGNYERWIPFRDLFESLIASNTALPNVQKLHYLRSALTGEAAKVINSLEITNDNYVMHGIY